jgi:hypothetical protein
MAIQVKRSETILKPDQSRVLLRPFSPGNAGRVGGILARILAIPEDQVASILDEVTAEFSQRHQHIHKLFLERFEQVRQGIPIPEELSKQRRLLIGSYFLAEYYM